jgi:2-polyprenyl-3-methyl-5-hydroxy-6-metoxy-1,4-benzoquinol methylase
MKISPFKIEHNRNDLAIAQRLDELKKTYTSKFPEIIDLNSQVFWNERLTIRQPLSDQDGMTQKRSRIISQLLPLSVRTLLDLGIGPGWVEELLEKRGTITFFGTDISDKTIKNVKKRFKGNFWVESIYEKHKRKEKYDAIMTLEVMEHIPPSKTFVILKKIHDLLIPNGYYVVSVPTNEGLEIMKDNPNGHVRLYTVPLICAELEIAGFKVLNIKTIYAFKNYYFIKDILAKIMRHKWKPNNIIVLAQKI